MKTVTEFLNQFKWILLAIAILAVLFVVNKKCENDPPETTTVVDIVKIKDSIRNVLIKEIEPVYIDTGSTKYVKGDTKWLKGKDVVKWKDSIVYVDKPTGTTITAQQFSATLKGDKSSADIKITALGEVLDVQGVITCENTNTTVTQQENKQKSGLFVYFETQAKEKPQRFELGLDWQVKNFLIIGISGDHNSITNDYNANVKLGFRIL